MLDATIVATLKRPLLYISTTKTHFSLCACSFRPEPSFHAILFHSELLGQVRGIRHYEARPRGYKTFSMLNSAEHEIYPIQNVKMPTIVGILTFISMLNTTSERLKARNFFHLLVF